METINERFRQLREAKKLTQEDFASGAHRTRSEIKNIEYGKTTPKEEVILGVCAAYNVSQKWLRTGQGDMFNPISRNDEIKSFIDDTMKAESSDFRQRMLAVLAKLDPNEWELLEQIALKLAAEAQAEQRTVLKIAGRDGSFQEHAMTDDEKEALLEIADQLPDADNDL